MTCKNCNKAFTCGCQKRKAADGSNVHATCLSEYNNKVGVVNPSPSNSLTKTVQNARKNLNR